jgi:hypothetical protein
MNRDEHKRCRAPVARFDRAASRWETACRLLETKFHSDVLRCITAAPNSSLRRHGRPSAGIPPTTRALGRSIPRDPVQDWERRSAFIP